MVVRISTNKKARGGILTLEEKMYEQFVALYPEYKKAKEAGLLHMNVYCDIMISTGSKNKIIARSDVPHDLRKVGMKLLTTWIIQ